MLKAFYTTVRGLLSGKDWVYVLALLLPLTIYNLALKATSVAIKDETNGLLSALNLMRSDFLFAIGYVVFWIGVFAIVRSGIARAVVVVLFHAVSLLVVLVTTVAYQYFEGTGSTLDYSVIVFYLSTLGEVKDIIASEASFLVWAALIAAVLYVLLGPWLVTRLIRRGSSSSGRVEVGSSRLEAFGLCAMAAGFSALAFVPAVSDANQSFSRSPFVNVLATGVSAPGADELTVEEVSARAATSLSDVKLSRTSDTERRNVVFIHLESVGARSTTPYNPDLATTPFLDKLADESLLVDRAYTTIPHTSKAITSLNCGIYPHPETDIYESEPDGVPVKCLPELLGEEGYKSVTFQSAIGKFEDRPQLVENFGYDKFIGLEDLDTKGFEKAGYLGYEDDILLKPSREWLVGNGKKPFVASYIGITPHHEYLAPKRYGREPLAKEDVMNRYLNAVRYDDFWVRNLIRQYKDLGLYENTIFVIYGDHGEAFGEHEVKGHDGVPYEEGLRVPLIIHDPSRWSKGKEISPDTPANHMDIPPTILDLLGYKTRNGSYPGASLLDIPEDRTLYFGCRPDLLCLTSITGYEKFIYHFGKRPDELYDLSKDPLEKNNLAPQLSVEELEKRREDMLRWRSESIATFDKPTENSE